MNRTYFIRFILFTLFIVIPGTSSSQEPAQPSFGKDSIEVLLEKANSEIYNNISEAFLHLENASRLAELHGEEEQKARLFHSYAVANYVKGNYDTSLKYYHKAEAFFQEEGDHLWMAKCLIGSGLIQQGIDRHAIAIEYFKRAITSYEKAGKPAFASPAYINIAISEMEEGAYSKARNNLEHAINLSKETDRKDLEHLALNKLGDIHFFEGDYDSAIAFYHQVLQDEEEPNNWEKSFANGGLAQAYLEQNKLALAEDHALASLSFAENVQSLWDLERNTKILSEIYERKGQTEKAFAQLQANQMYRDSLYDQKKLQQINVMQLERKEAENSRLQAEKEITSKQLFFNRVILISLILLSVLLGILLFLLRKNSRQQAEFNRKLEQKNHTIEGQNKVILQRNKELDVSNIAKDRLFSILSHDLRSPIGSIQQLLELMKTEKFSTEELHNLMDEMHAQVSQTSNMLQNILHWANSQLKGYKVNIRNVALGAEVRQVIGVYEIAAKYKKISLTHDLPPDLPHIAVDKAHLSIILHNLISNAFKFTPEGRSITLNYTENEERIALLVYNEGEGMAPEKIREIKNHDYQLISQMGTGMENGSGIGLMMVKYFLQANHGRLDIKSDPNKGTTFIISFLRSHRPINHEEVVESPYHLN